MFDIRGSRAIVTGSARGFGREFAIRLLGSGARVCLSDVLEDAGRATEKELAERFGKENVAFFKCDVREESEWRELWDAAEKALGGKINILVNNAGVAPSRSGSGRWRLVCDTNFTGVAIGAYLAVEKMEKSKGGEGGRIVNIASYAGILTGELGDIYSSSYNAAKWGVVGLTRSFADAGNNLEKEDVRAYALCPWFANTQLVRDSVDIPDLEKRTQHRVLRIEEVGAAMMTALRLDKTGACYGIFPDAPLMEVPDPNRFAFAAFLFASKVLRRLGLHEPEAADSSGYVLRYRTVAAVNMAAIVVFLLLIKLAAFLIDVFIF